MDPNFKKFLDSLLCPLCSNPIDSFERVFKRYIVLPYNYGCVDNPNHYNLWIDQWGPPFGRIDAETIVIYENNIEYRLALRYYADNNQPYNLTSITTSKIDDDYNFIEGTYKILQIEDILFDVRSLNKISILKKIKEILILQ